MAASKDTHVLLKTVALVPHQDRQFIEAWGVGLRSAIIAGVSSKSYWHLARTPATQQGMSNAWLKARGLISIRDQWMKAQGYS
jgi:hypothetical protein